MSCMCGDTHCPSCGPAQGNWRCPICGSWADDGCEHMTEDGSDIKPEFYAQAVEAEERENERMAELAEEYAAERKLDLMNDLGEYRRLKGID